MNTIGRFAEFIEDWRFLIKRDGYRFTLPIIGLEVSQLPYRHLKFIILARKLDETLPKLQINPDIEIRAFQTGDIEEVSKINRPSEGRLCARRMSRNHIGLLATYKSQLAGYAWSCAKVDPQLERVPLMLEDGDIFCTDAFTTPEFRGKGVQTSLTLARLNRFHGLGFKRAICFIEMHNLASLAVWRRKLGGHTIGMVDFQRIGLWYRVRIT